MLYFGVPSTLLHPHSSYEFIELRKEMSASLRSDTGKKLKLLEFPRTFPGMVNLESKNLGILFWSWGILCGAGTQSCNSIPEQRCFSACIWAVHSPTALNSDQVEDPQLRWCLVTIP